MSTEDHEQTRRHFEVVAEGLRSELRQVADGVAMNTETLERFRAETKGEFATVRREMTDGFAAVRSETAREFATVRREMTDGFAAVRSETARELAAVRAEVADGSAALRAEMADGFASIGGETPSSRPDRPQRARTRTRRRPN